MLPGVLLFAGVAALLFLGGRVPQCLGPLGVTAVQCAKASGVIPNAGPGALIFAGLASLALLVAWPVPRMRLRAAAIGTAAATALAIVGYLLLQPRTMEGFDSAGTWISIARPLDSYALVAFAIVAGVLGAALGARLGSTRS